MYPKSGTLASSLLVLLCSLYVDGSKLESTAPSAKQRFKFLPDSNYSNGSRATFEFRIEYYECSLSETHFNAG